jgi:hypothetical protein
MFGRRASTDLPPSTGLALQLEFGAASTGAQRAAVMAAFSRQGLPPPLETVLRPPLRGLGPPPTADLCVVLVDRQARASDAHRHAVAALLPGLFEAWTDAEKAVPELVIRRLHVSARRRETFYAWRRTDSAAEIKRGMRTLVDWDHRPGQAYGWDAEAGQWGRL